MGRCGFLAGVLCGSILTTITLATSASKEPLLLKGKLSKLRGTATRLAASLFCQCMVSLAPACSAPRSRLRRLPAACALYKAGPNVPQPSHAACIVRYLWNAVAQAGGCHSWRPGRAGQRWGRSVPAGSPSGSYTAGSTASLQGLPIRDTFSGGGRWSSGQQRNTSGCRGPRVSAQPAAAGQDHCGAWGSADTPRGARPRVQQRRCRSHPL